MYSSIAIVVPFFGKLPKMFSLWKSSAVKNSTIDFYLFTNDKFVESEQNFKVIYMEFEEFVDILREKFGKDIVCNQPYKICDFRPALGYCFDDLLSGYDFWGFCDTDIVLGDIRSFIDESLLNKYSKIGVSGHFQLYKNVKCVNELFLDNGEYPEYNWQEAFKTEESCYFDEYFGIHYKVFRNKVSFYNLNDVHEEVRSDKRDFFVKNRRCILVWENGKLFLVFENQEKRELLYCHIPKREMDSEEINGTKMMIVPGKIVNYSSITNEVFRGQGPELFFTIKYGYNKIKKSYQRYGISGNVKRSIRKKAMRNYWEKVGW